MTNQEAIKRIKEHIEIHKYRESHAVHIVEALEMAISALQAQELSKTQKPLDTISRQAGIDVLDAYQVMVENGEENPYAWARLRMSELPSAQPEIIRCKDCKWWSNDDYRECSSPNYDDGYVTPAGFYCGYAERRTDETD